MRLIDAEEVIKAIDRHTFDTVDGLCLDEDITIILEEVPTAQPEKRTEKHIETHTCDLISRQAAIRFIRDKVSLSLFMKRSVDKADKACMELCDMLDRDVPSAQPKKGKWIGADYDGDIGLYMCDQCGKFAMMKSNFCPNCGADMRGEQDE